MEVWILILMNKPIHIWIEMPMTVFISVPVVVLTVSATDSPTVIQTHPSTLTATAFTS